MNLVAIEISRNDIYFCIFVNVSLFIIDSTLLLPSHSGAGFMNRMKTLGNYTKLESILFPA